jgi:hypothetical protein
MARTILIGCIGLLLAAYAPAEPVCDRGECGTEHATRESAPIDEVAKDALLYLREEEKLARDVYVALGDVHGIPAFRNIAAAEQRHMNALLAILRRYEIPDVVGENPVGVFQNGTLRKLHADMVARGKKSPVEALAVGAAIEEMDIADLKKLLSVTTDEAVRQTLENLMRGSRNHLRAFTGLLRAKGVTYVPSHLESQEFEAILASGHERGREGSGANGRRGRAGRGHEGASGRRAGAARGRAGAGSRGRDDKGGGRRSGCEGKCQERGRRGSPDGNPTGDAGCDCAVGRQVRHACDTADRCASSPDGGHNRHRRGRGQGGGRRGRDCR